MTMRARVLISGGSFPRARAVEEILVDGGFDAAIAMRADDCMELARFVRQVGLPAKS